MVTLVYTKSRVLIIKYKNHVITININDKSAATAICLFVMCWICIFFRN